MPLIKKYKTPQFGPIGDKAWKEYKKENKMKLDYASDSLKEKGTTNRGVVDTKTNSQPDLSPYTKPKGKTEVKATPKKYRSLEPAVDYPVYDSTPRNTTTQNTTSSSKEVTTGTLSKPESSQPSDKMSWAREAEKKARKMMGGKD